MNKLDDTSSDFFFKKKYAPVTIKKNKGPVTWAY